MLDIVLEDLTFSYDDGDVILDGISMHVKAGDFVCLLGQSGCGKSTLLRLMAGLESPAEGAILIDGLPVQGAGLQHGVVFQDYGLFPWMTAGENITIALERRYPEMKKEERRDFALHWMEHVGMDKALCDKLPGELSGGWKQRCGIARGIVLKPKVMLFDEPTSALDPYLVGEVQSVIKGLVKAHNMTIVIVTHEMAFAEDIADRIVYMNDGHIIESGPPARIFDYPQMEETRQFLAHMVRK